MDYLIASSVGLTYFACYVQFSPNIGNVWIRPDGSGNKKLFINGLLSLMYEPFRLKKLWHPKFWDLNWITTTGIIVYGYHIYKIIS